MWLLMGLVKNAHGVYHARKKVPKGLEEAVARVLGSARQKQSWLKRSLGTKDISEANRRAKPVQIEFDRTLERARELLKERPLRTTLAKTEIDRMAEFHYAAILSDDDEYTREGGNEALVRSIAKQLSEEGVEYTMRVPLDPTPPEYGLSDRGIFLRGEAREDDMETTATALARGDISPVKEYVGELLDIFGINLDRASAAYREVGVAILRAHVRALEALRRRHAGEPIDTPPIPDVNSRITASGGGTLGDAYDGWLRERTRPKGTTAEFDRALSLFAELHGGGIPIADIRLRHVRRFREALQQLPSHRPGKLAKATLHELAEWTRQHPEDARLAPPTVNKLLGAVQTIARWGRKHGIVPDEVQWSDPFANMRLEEDQSDRGPFTLKELEAFFSSPVFSQGERPRSGCGEAAFWLPVLGIFSGARRNELAGLTVANVEEEAISGRFSLVFVEDKARGKTLKTKASARKVPLHPEVIRLGFLSFVDDVRKLRGQHGWLFPEVSPEAPSGAKAWSKWFRRYLNSIGIKDARRVFHSFRHNFTDALRAAKVGEDVNDALTGHAGGSVGRRYGAKEKAKAFGFDVLYEAVASVKYPGVKFVKREI